MPSVLHLQEFAYILSFTELTVDFDSTHVPLETPGCINSAVVIDDLVTKHEWITFNTWI